MEYINEQNIINDVDDVNMSDDSEHYYERIANPAKVKSKKDLKINSLLTELNIKNQKLDKLENQQKYIQAAIDFLDIEFEFNIDNIQLEMYSYGSINNFKTIMLTKAREFTNIRKSYDELINWKEIDENIWFYFHPLIENKFLQIDNIFSYESGPDSYYTENFVKVLMGLTVIVAVGVRAYHFFY